MSDLPKMASTPCPRSNDGTAPLPPLGPPRSGNGGAGLSPSLSGPSRRRRHARECGPTLPGLRRPRGRPGTAPGGASEGREGAGKARGGWRGRRGAGKAREARNARGELQDGGSGVRGRRGGAGAIAVPPGLTDLGVPAARQGPVAPVSRGGEAQAQEEAAGAEPQLVFHGRQVPRWASRVSPCPAVVPAVSLPFSLFLSTCLFHCLPPSLRVLPRFPPGSPSVPPGVPFSCPFTRFLPCSRCPSTCPGPPARVPPGDSAVPTLSPQAVTRSRPCSAMPRPSCSAWAAPRCCASPRGARPGSPRVGIPVGLWEPRESRG